MYTCTFERNVERGTRPFLVWVTILSWRIGRGNLNICSIHTIVIRRNIPLHSLFRLLTLHQEIPQLWHKVPHLFLGEYCYAFTWHVAVSFALYNGIWSIAMDDVHVWHLVNTFDKIRWTCNHLLLRWQYISLSTGLMSLQFFCKAFRVIYHYGDY